MLQVLEAAAITVIITDGTIFLPLRSRGPALWRELVSCPLCLGWWIGAISALWRHPTGLEPVELAWHVAAAGALSGCAALLFHCLIGWLDWNTEKPHEKASEKDPEEERREEHSRREDRPDGGPGGAELRRDG
jgi:hypothetical protein